MYCGMYCGMYCWYVLNTNQHVFNTNRYAFNIYWSVLVCIVLALCKYSIIISANTDSIHITIHTIIHAKYIVYCNTCQYIPACISMYYVGIWYVWNYDTSKYWPNTCVFFNTCQYWRLYIHQYKPSTINLNKIQTVSLWALACVIYPENLNSCWIIRLISFWRLPPSLCIRFCCAAGWIRFFRRFNFRYVWVFRRVWCVGWYSSKSKHQNCVNRYYYAFVTC